MRVIEIILFIGPIIIGVCNITLLCLFYMSDYRKF